MSDTVLAYHVTNEKALQDIQQSGYFGLDLQDYYNLCLKLDAAVGAQAASEIFRKWVATEITGEMLGEVSFWANRNTALKHLNYEDGKHKETLGEQTTIFRKIVLRTYKRHLPVKHAAMVEAVDLVLGTYSPKVMITIAFPRVLLSSQSLTDLDAGWTGEIYTTGKVPARGIGGWNWRQD
jgi:hypothetical protein